MYKRVRMLVNYFMLIMICTLVVSTTVNAYDYKTVKAGKGDPKNIYHWHQSNMNAPSVPDNAWNFEVAPGRTLGGMGCGYFSTSYMLVKMGEENPKDGFTPVSFAKEFSSKKLYRDHEYVDFKKVKDLYPDVECVEDRTNVGNKSKEEQMAYAKGKFNDGNFIILCVSVVNGTGGHYIFLDGFDGNDAIIGDSAYNGKKWSDYYGKENTTIETVTVFKHKKKKSTECPSIYDDVTLSNSMSKEEENTYKGIVSEFELNGMPDLPTYLEKQDPIYYPERDSLSTKELSTIEEIKENISGRKMNIVKFTSILIMLLGLFLCVYAIFLFVGGVLDITNNWVDISFVERLTFGRCRVIDDESVFGSKNKLAKGDFTLSQWRIRCIIVAIIGALLLSGIIQKIIYFILRKTMGM